MLVNAHAWYDAYIAIFLVSALPNLLLILIPSKLLTSKSAKGALNYQNMLLTFAAAGLLGDVFLHTLPHLIAPHSHSHGGAHHDVHEGHDHHDHDDEHEHHDHDHYEDAHEHHDHDHHDHGFEAHSHVHEDFVGSGHDHDHSDLYSQIGLERSVVIGIVLLLGFLVFMFAEKIASGHSHSHGHDHSHNSDDEHTDECNTTTSTTSSAASTATKNDLASPTAVRRSSRINDSKSSSTPSLTTTTSSTSSTASTTATTTTSTSLFAAMQSNLKASGWLNLIADSIHNFTDGIAIGASFASGHGLAYATFLSVIFHEIPHEIGDFTILIQSGLTKSQAIKAQFVTAIAAVLGVSVGLLARRSETAEELLLSFTAGGFLYLAAVNMLPSIVRTKSSALQSVLELLCFVAGVGMMVLVTFLE